MRTESRLAGFVVIVAMATSCAVSPRELAEGENPLARETIQAIARLVADRQLAHGRGDALEWTNAVFYSGVMATYRLTGDERYRDAMTQVGERHGWRIGARYRHADDHAVAQTYLELQRLDGDPRMSAAFRDAVDRMLVEPPEWPKPHQTVDYWWADALFMSPPALALLAEVTGEDRYLDLVDRLWHETHALLYDELEGLYHRDLRFRSEADPKFWSRGNGWVLAGLARLLDVLPEDHPTRFFYEDAFRRLAARVVTLQSEDGLWRSDLHASVSEAAGESSGSALFCFGLAWGLDRGLLRQGEFGEPARRSWSALYRNVDESGRLGWVQKPGAKPGRAPARHGEAYGSGAFLLAAEQVAKLDVP